MFCLPYNTGRAWLIPRPHGGEQPFGRPLPVVTRRDGRDQGDAADPTLFYRRDPLLADAADGDRRPVAHQGAVAVQPLQPLGARGHGLGVGREDMAECDIGGGQLAGTHQLEVAVGGDAKAQPGGLNGGEIGGLHVLLPQMHAPSARLDGLLPVVVDKKPRPITTTERHGLGNGRCHLGGGQVLDAQLYGLDPGPQQAFEPLHRVHHGIEAQMLFGCGEGAVRQTGAACFIQAVAAIQGWTRQQVAGEVGEAGRPAEMGDGPRARPHSLRRRQPLLQVGARQGDGVIQRVVLRHHGGDGAGVAAAGAVAVAGIEARRRQPEFAGLVLVVVEAEITAPLKVASLDQHGAGAEFAQPPCGEAHQLGAGGGQAGQGLQLGAVGGDKRQTWQQLFAHRRQHAGLRHGGAGAGDGHRIVDHEGSIDGAQPAGQHLHMEPGRQQADFDGSRRQIQPQGVDLGGEGLHQHRVDHLHRHRVLGRDGGDDGAAVHAEVVHRVQVSLNAGPAAGVGPRYGPDHGTCLRHRCQVGGTDSPALAAHASSPAACFRVAAWW